MMAHLMTISPIVCWMMVTVAPWTPATEDAVTGGASYGIRPALAVPGPELADPGPRTGDV